MNPLEPNAWRNHLAGDCDALITLLAEQGWAVVEGFFTPHWAKGALAEIRAIERTGGFKLAAVGRRRARKVARRIRSGENHWLLPDSAPPYLAVYFAVLNELMALMNRRFFLGLWSLEVNAARYPPGAFYRRHVDAFKGRSNRKVSTIAYLQEGWRPDHGGLLRMWTPDGAMVEIPPSAGTLVCFLSEETPHEVLPARRRTRYSLSGWFRVREGPIL